MKRTYPRLARQWACNRVRRLATRAGRLDALGQLGELTIRACRLARRIAVELGAFEVDVDDATFEGLDAGRARR